MFHQLHHWLLLIFISMTYEWSPLHCFTDHCHWLQSTLSVNHEFYYLQWTQWQIEQVHRVQMYSLHKIRKSNCLVILKVFRPLNHFFNCQSLTYTLNMHIKFCKLYNHQCCYIRRPNCLLLNFKWCEEKFHVDLHDETDFDENFR